MADSPPTVNEPLYLIKGIGMIASFFIGIFAVFYGILNHNYSISGGAVVLEAICVTLLNMNAAYKNGKLREKFKIGVLIFYLVFGIIISVLMFCIMLFYTYLTIDENRGFESGENGTGPPAALFGMASFWGAVLAVDSYRFKALLQVGLGPV